MTENSRINAPHRKIWLIMRKIHKIKIWNSDKSKSLRTPVSFHFDTFWTSPNEKKHLLVAIAGVRRENIMENQKTQRRFIFTQFTSPGDKHSIRCFFSAYENNLNIRYRVHYIKRAPLISPQQFWWGTY